MLSWILHDWDDEHALMILKNCTYAMGVAGRVILVEHAAANVSVPGLGDGPADAVAIREA